MDCEQCEARLDAYNDGELSPERAAEVREHLRECVACTGAAMRLGELTQRLETGLESFRAPDVLRARLRAALVPQEPDVPVAPPRRSSHWRFLLAASLVAMASSSATWLVMRERGAERALTDDVVTSHVRSLMPNHLMDVASTDQHNVKPWFNGRVDISPPVPVLSDSGFPLLGGRLDYVAGRQVPVVVYGRRRHIINVYTWPDAAGDSPPSATASHGYHVVGWHHDQVMSRAVSDLNTAELMQFVSLYRSRESP